MNLLLSLFPIVLLIYLMPQTHMFHLRKIFQKYN